jgi:transposase
VDTIEDSKPLIRRRHSPSLKAQVLAECAKPEASISRIAMAHGLNANLVHKWRRLASELVPAAASAPSFIALPLAAPPAQAVLPPDEDVRIELHRGPLAIKVHWPVSAAPACAAWLRELLR